MEQPSEAAMQKMRNFVQKYCEKSGTTTHPIDDVKEGVILGLAANVDQIGRPLCPCRFYPDKNEEVKHRTWICACDDMQIYKYCHCLLFVTERACPSLSTSRKTTRDDGCTGLVKDPTPDKGRVLRAKAEEREIERRERPS